MRTIICILLLSLICHKGLAQTPTLTLALDSFEHQLAVTKHDTSRVMFLNAKAGIYQFTNPDSALILGEQALLLARKINFPKGESGALSVLGFTYMLLGYFPKALELELNAEKIAEKNNLIYEKANAIHIMGNIYYYSKDSSKQQNAIANYQEGLKLFNSIDRDFGMIAASYEGLAIVYTDLNKLDSALYCIKLSYDYSNKHDQANWVKPFALMDLGALYLKKGDIKQALDYLMQSINLSKIDNILPYSTVAYYSIAATYQQINQLDSSIYYAEKGLKEAQKTKFYANIIYASTLLADLYKKKDKDKVIHYNAITIEAQDNLYNSLKTHSIDNLTAFDVQERQFEIDKANTEYRNKIRQYGLLAGLGVFLIIAFILYRNNQKEKKAKNLLQVEKEKVESTLSQLKATQTQLIQSEKLASLGELTAGIAHEIQNPLNFVNNFSELSVDLVKDLKEEIDKPEQDKEYIGELFDDLRQNQEKINHHGKRASSIVKGMLEHSRASTGIKELTDINKLADEYLRLAYHGFKAKNDSFDTDLKTEFEGNLPKIEVIPQDMGRVLLNLINNAFYAVHQRAQPSEGFKPSEGYVPTVTVSTQQIDNQIIIKVKDNGTGMPESVKAKVFQPFFTTKPTGQGTGLGLSLAYDIVTKGHGSTLEVISTEGVGSEFIINLPIKTNQ